MRRYRQGGVPGDGELHALPLAALIADLRRSELGLAQAGHNDRVTLSLAATGHGTISHSADGIIRTGIRDACDLRVLANTLDAPSCSSRRLDKGWRQLA